MIYPCKVKALLLFLFSFCFLNISYSQKEPAADTAERPEIGLVLSGGAAKGIAHVGILKILEEVGIRPDYITGTSMGAIVGGLYSIGYTADELEEMAAEINWDKILTDEVPLNKIVMEEKDDFERYLLELPVRNFEFSLPSSLTEGYQLEKLFNDLTWGATTYNEFDSLPIPFHCMAVDIVEGRPVEFGSGHLATAMRASMAIPGVFSAVQIDSMMLVDGGVIRNLPVQEAIDMGADIVIAVYVGFEKNVTPEDLFSLSEVLTRTTIFLGVIDSKQQMKLADILISPDMTGVSATSFSNSDTIVARGERAARRVKDRLQHLADSLNLTFQPVEKLSGPPFIYVSDVEVENLRYVNESFVIGQGNIFPGTYTNKSQIEKAVERIYGTRYFRKVGYRLEHLSGMKYRLIYMTKEGSRASVKIAPHYSNQLGTGITLNTTLRNYLIPSSRIKFTANVAESPGIKFDLNKYFGKEQKMIGHQFVYWNQAKLPVFFEGENVGNYKHSLFQTGIGSKYSISFNQQVGFDFFYERSMVKPGGAVENFYPQADFDNYAAGGFAYRAYFHFNSLNDKYFATKGTKFDITLKRVMKPLSTYKIEGDQSLDEEIFNLDVKPFNTFQLNVDQYVPIGNNFSINTGTGIGLSSTQAPITNHFALGGLLYSEKYKYETFYGLHFGEQIIANFWKVSTVLNYQITSRIFFTAAGNVAVTGDELDVFLSSIGAWKSSDYLKGFATGLRFNTFIGPLVLMVGDNDLDGNPRWYVSFGYKF